MALRVNQDDAMTARREIVGLHIGPSEAETFWATFLKKSWLGKFGQADEWISCLTAAKLPRIRRDHDEANAPDA